MALGAIGPSTAGIELLATAVGAGILLGGFLAGLFGSALGWPHDLRAERVLVIGYGGGAVGVLAVLFDLFFRYVV
jgi:hypothetical protein